ncbi:hypothetical protein ACW9UR_13760 [Halovulum sp. GXIMD14794]
MAVIVVESEGTPAAYPAAPGGLSAAAQALDAAMIWQRLESWIAYRWGTRSVTYIVEGPGEFVPRLSPVTFSAIECWNGEAYEAVTLEATPRGGYQLKTFGPYKFTGTAGEGSSPLEVPASVEEAFIRYAEYVAGRSGDTPGARSESVSVGAVSTSFTRDAAFMAKALHWSGAADLLRCYRRAS